MQTNLDAFKNEEFSEWAGMGDLLPVEDYLLSKYLLSPHAADLSDARIFEAGTGAGRILFSLYAKGARNLTGCDICRPLLEVAESRKKSLQAESMSFFEADICALKLSDDSVDTAVYLQQVLCFINSPEARAAAVEECFRIVKPGGQAIVSFLSFEGRMVNYPLAATVFLSRVIRGEMKKAGQFGQLPWLKRGGKPNWRFLDREQAQVHWFTRKAACDLMTKAGFEIEACFSQKMFQEREFKRFAPGGGLYLVARKPAQSPGRVLPN